MGRLLIILGLVISCASCTPAVHNPPEPPPGYAAELEPYEEAVDTECSYFNFLWGKAAEQEGKFEEAGYAYEQSLLCDRLATQVMRSLAALLLKTGKRQEAIGWLNKVVELDPQDDEARILLAKIHASMGSFSEAVEIYQAILEKDPQNFNVMLMLGGLYARFQKFSQAQEILERLVEQNQDSYAAYYYLAKLYRELLFYDKALAAYRRALELNWSNMLALETADLYEREKQEEEAVKLYERILLENPSDERLRGYLARMLLRMGKVDRAIEELEKVRSYSPEPRIIDLTISKILLDNNRFEQAIARLTPMLGEEPGAQDVRSLLSLAYYKQGDISAAKQLLQETPPGSEGYEESILMLARILQDENQVPEAEKILREAMADSRNRQLSFYVALANLYHAREQTGKGHEVFREAFRAFANKSQVMYEHGLYYHKIGDVDGAMEQMLTVLKIDSQHPQALNYVGYTWAEEGRNLDQALQYIQTAVEKLPDDGYVRDSLGWVHFQMGNFELAVEELEKAVEFSPHDPTIFEHLGDAYLQVGMRENALKAYGTSLDLYEEEKDKDKIRRKMEQVRGGKSEE